MNTQINGSTIYTNENGASLESNEVLRKIREVGSCPIFVNYFLKFIEKDGHYISKILFLGQADVQPKIAQGGKWGRIGNMWLETEFKDNFLTVYIVLVSNQRQYMEQLNPYIVQIPKYELAEKDRYLYIIDEKVFGSLEELSKEFSLTIFKSIALEKGIFSGKLVTTLQSCILGSNDKPITNNLEQCTSQANDKIKSLLS